MSKIENAFQENDTSNAWKIVNAITNRKQAISGKLSDKTPEERKNQWVEKFPFIACVRQTCIFIDCPRSETPKDFNHP